MKVHLFLYLFLGSIVLPVQAAEAQPAQSSSPISKLKYSVNLMQLYRESRLEDPRVIAAYSKAQSGVEQENQAFGSLLPSVTANAGFNRIEQSTAQMNDGYNSHRYTVGLTQPLYNRAAWANYQRYKSLSKQASYESLDAQAEATVDLAQRYFVALAADDELELVQAERRATQKNLDRVSALYAKQLATITNLLDLKSRIDSLAAQEVEARNQSNLSRIALSEIIGRPITEKLSRVRNDIELRVSAESLESWVNLAVTENPAIKAGESAQQAAEAALRAGKADHYPTVNLNLSAQQTNEGYNNSLAPQTDSYVAGVGVQIPIYSGGSMSARARQLYQDQITAEQQLIAIRRQVAKETAIAYMTADSSVEKIRANRNALVSAEQSRIAAEKAFTYGVVNAVDVLAAVQNEFKARRDLLKTQYDFITNLFILNRWAGKLSEESVESVNVWLSSDEKSASLPKILIE